MRNGVKFIFLILALVLFCLLHLQAGPSTITFSTIWESLFHYNSSDTQHIIAHDLRIPRLIMAIIAGAGLSLAGLLMQTIFKNTLAEPNILGISTGSSLFVAISLLTGISILQTDLGIISSALLGGLIFGLIILIFAQFVRSQTSLLLIGIMLGSFSASFISILQVYSDANQLKTFTLWGMGSLQNITFDQVPLVSAIFLGTTFLTFLLIRQLNALTLGSENAAQLGINLRSTRTLVILITSIFTGLITAFCGPIAFIGMAVPNLVKLLFRTQQHSQLIIATLLLGAIFMIICDAFIQYVSTTISLPLNAMTSLIGAPFVIAIILKRWS